MLAEHLAGVAGEVAGVAVGRVVEAVRYYGTYMRFVDGLGPVHVDMAWICIDRAGEYAIEGAFLRPISDPSLDTENQNDCMDMNLLTVLPFTKEAA